MGYFANEVRVTAANVFDALDKTKAINCEQKLGMEMSWSRDFQHQLHILDETIRVVEDGHVKFLDGTVDPDYTSMPDAYSRWFTFIGAILIIRLSETKWEVNAWYHD